MLVFAAACSIVAAAESPVIAPKPAPDALRQILQKWQARESATATARFAWSVDRDGLDRSGAYQTANVPKSATTATEPQYRLLLDHDRLRYSSNRWHRFERLEYAGFSRLQANEAFPTMSTFYTEMNARFADPSGQLSDPVPFTRIFDGQRRIDFFAASEQRSPLAFIADASTVAMPSDDFTEDLFYRPLLLMYRASAVVGARLQPADWRLAERDSFVDGRHCGFGTRFGFPPRSHHSSLLGR